MCKYCELETRLDYDSEFNSIIDIENNWRGPQLYVGTTIDGGTFGYVDVETNININFCPICGRQLREGESFIQ